MLEFTVNGHKYRGTDMDMRQKLHVGRRLLPLVGEVFALIPLMEAMRESPPKDANETEQQIRVMMPLIRVFSRMEDDELNYIMDRVFAVTQREIAPGQYGPIWNARASRMMFDDITLQHTLTIAQNVVMDNCGDFLFMSGLGETETASPPVTKPTLASVS